MDPVKGAHRAIKAARLAGRRLVLAGPVQSGQEQYFAEQVEPFVDGLHVHYIGEVAGTAKQELFANAAALLMPVRWQEPFGMVMIEALACGTPVIAFPEGATAEIVIDGHNGMLVSDEAEMARAVDQLGSIDPLRCRASAAERYDISITAAGYEQVYRQAIAAARAHETPSVPSHALASGRTVKTVGEYWQRAKTANGVREVTSAYASAALSTITATIAIASVWLPLAAASAAATHISSASGCASWRTSSRHQPGPAAREI
jgi:Glycosyl transferases group 1